jgi:hypothetical protein
MYTYSSEIRWFLPGTMRQGDALLAWFAKPLIGYGRDPKELLVLEVEDPTHPRIDEYLIMPATTTVGTKLRGGDKVSSFEIKAEAAAAASWRTGERISGRVDSWTKWSFKDPTLNEALEPMRQGGKWIRIAKDRWLRKVSADSVKPTFVVANMKAYRKDHVDAALRQPPDSGCNLELTQIFVDNDRQDPQKAWITICLEAFSPDLARTHTILDSCANLCFDELGIPPGVQLTEHNSLSYSGWFVTLEGQQVAS